MTMIFLINVIIMILRVRKKFIFYPARDFPD